MEDIILSKTQAAILLNSLKPQGQIMYYSGVGSGKTYCNKLAKEILQKDPEYIKEFIKSLEDELKQKNRK